MLLKFFKFIYLFLAVLYIPCLAGFSLVGGIRGYCLVAVCRLLIAVVSIVSKHGLEGTRTSAVAPPGLESTGSAVVVQGLSCSAACGIFLDQGMNLNPLC